MVKSLLLGVAWSFLAVDIYGLIVSNCTCHNCLFFAVKGRPQMDLPKLGSCDSLSRAKSETMDYQKTRY
jgi:hypothetical protein